MKDFYDPTKRTKLPCCPGFTAFEKVVVPAAYGDETQYKLVTGKFKNTLLVYEVNSHVYLFTQDGLWTRLDNAGVWGSITGDINGQADLKEALDAKADESEVNGKATKITLYSDGNAIYSDAEMTTTMTYAEIKALVDDENNIVVLDNGNYELRYEYENEQGEDNAIWFNAVTMLSGKTYFYRIIINSNNEVLNDEAQLIQPTDYATATTGGVVKITGEYSFTGKADGRPCAATLSYENYRAYSENNFISKGTLENVITGKSINGTHTLTQSELDALILAGTLTTGDWYGVTD